MEGGHRSEARDTVSNCDRQRLRGRRGQSLAQESIQHGEAMANDFFVKTEDDHQKLIAPPTEQKIIRTQQRADRGSNLTQRVVAGGMSEGVVDALQVVQVNESD